MTSRVPGPRIRNVRKLFKNLVSRDLKIPRFRVRVRVRSPVPVLDYTGNQSNLSLPGTIGYDLGKNVAHKTCKMSPHLCFKKFFRNPKTLQIRKTSVYVRIWIPFCLISKDKDHKNLPVSPFSPGANIRVDHRLPRENV